MAAVVRRAVDFFRSSGRIRSERQLELSQAALPFQSLVSRKPASNAAALMERVREMLPGQAPRKLDIATMAKFYPPRPEFHPLSQSPHASLKQLNHLITEYSSCPSCLAIDDQLPPEEWNDISSIPGGTSRREAAGKSRERPSFNCPDCGFPTHCSREHWEQDEAHKQVCGTLRQLVEDEHDLRSERKFWEMNFPGRQEKNAYLNFTNWPYLLTTRKFAKPILQNAIVQRHISRYLTYPYTIASMLFNPWVYYDEKAVESPETSVVTQTGWHLLSSLSHAMEVATKSAIAEYERAKFRGAKAALFVDEPTSPLLINDPFRIFILGPSVESQMPSAIWEQLSLSFPGVPFRVYFIGPESTPPRVEMTNRYSHVRPGTKRVNTIYSSVTRHQRPVTSQNPNGETTTVNSVVYPVSVNLRMEYIRANFEEVANTFGTFRRNRDVFVLFNAGVGHPQTRELWRPTLERLLKTRCLTVITSLNQVEQDHDVTAIQEDYEGKYVVAVRPTKNKFSSMRPDIPVDCLHDPDQWVYTNYGLFALHGIGSEVGDVQQEVFVDDPFAKKKWTWWIK